MRIILALCIVVGCALCGTAMSRAVRRRAEILDALVRGIRLLRIHMTSMFEPLQQSLARTDCAVLEGIGEDMGRGHSAAKAWETYKQREQRRGGAIDALTREDLQALDRLFYHLGESGRDAQDVLLDGTARILEQNLESACKKAGEAERLYISLGVLTGLMLALMVV